MNYSEYLRCLSIDASTEVSQPSGETDLDPKTRALARLAALVAASAASTSIHREVDDAIAAGARATEIVGVLPAVMPLVGRAAAVKAAPMIGLALGVDLDLCE